jgi:hypothetical protein
MRVNSTNVLDEGLRIGGRGRRMNPKVKISQTWRVLRISVVLNLAQSQSVSGRPLLAPIYRWPCLKDPVGFNTNYSVRIRYQLVFLLCLLLVLRGTKITGSISYTLVSSPQDSTKIVDSGWISNLHIFDLFNLRLLLFHVLIFKQHILFYFSRGFWLTSLASLTDQETS